MRDKMRDFELFVNGKSPPSIQEQVQGGARGIVKQNVADIEALKQSFIKQGEAIQQTTDSLGNRVRNLETYNTRTQDYGTRLGDNERKATDNASRLDGHDSTLEHYGRKLTTQENNLRQLDGRLEAQRERIDENEKKHLDYEYKHRGYEYKHRLYDSDIADHTGRLDDNEKDIRRNADNIDALRREAGDISKEARRGAAAALAAAGLALDNTPGRSAFAVSFAAWKDEAAMAAGLQHTFDTSWRVRGTVSVTSAGIGGSGSIGYSW